MPMTDLAPTSQEETAAPAEQELTETTRTALEDLVRTLLGEDKAGRRAEVREAWKQRSFRNGHQQIYYDSQTYSYMDIEASGLDLPRYRSVYNIFTPHWRSFVSILSQNPPGINFVPEDLQRSTDVTAAAYAEKMRHRVDRLVHMKDRQAEIASMFCTDGRTITRTYVDDKGKLRIEVGGVLEWKVPIYSGSDLAEWGYAVNSKEIDKWSAKDQYPDYAEEIESAEGSSEANYERMARLGILANRKGGGGYADALKDLVTRHIAWIRPSRYRKVDAKSQAELKAKYPEGVRVTIISGTAVECFPETMEETLAVGWPAPGKGQSRPSLLHDLTAIQEDFNDYMNMLREHIEFSIPATWVTDTVDEEALAEQRSAPGVIHTITIPANASINDLVFQEQVAQLPPELVGNLDRLLSLAQFTTGDLPSLSGEGDPHSETASGQRMLSDQAKGQLSPAWQGLQWLGAQTYEIATPTAARLVSDKGSIAVSGGPTGQQKFNPAAILDGKFGCYPDTDSSFPETMADKRAAFQAITERLASAGPAGLAIIMQPDNLKLGKQLGGLKDFIIPGAEARDKQLREIEQLLQEAPVPDPALMPQWMQMVQSIPANVDAMSAYRLQISAAQATGQQPPPQPQIVDDKGQPTSPPMKSSIDVGKRDYHQAELDKIIEWLSSPACYEEQLKNNQQGIENVELHADQHEAALAKIAAQNAPKPEPPKISLSVKVDDPTSVSQILALAGVTTDPETIQASNVPEEQEQAANTAHRAAQAQHQSVLAAREAVTPFDKSPTPDELNEREQ